MCSRKLKYLAIFLLFSSCNYLAFANDHIKPEELVQKHLASIGTQSARDSKSRVVEANAIYKVLVGGSGSVEGKGAIVSESSKSRFQLRVNTVEYKGEQFIYDGNKSSVAGTYADKSWSELGQFVRVQDSVLRDGLLGGELTTAWALLDEDSWKGRLSGGDLKKVDGQKLYRLQYRGKGAGDLDVQLYFDPKTYHHVMSVYRLTIDSGIGLYGETSSVERKQTRDRLEERFADFRTTNGVTLPWHYELRFTQETANGFTKSVEWELNVSRVMNDISLDPRNFEIK
jgi:hypothetical protein